jgi:hypothetical protein
MPTYYFNPAAVGSTGVGTLANPFTNQTQLYSMPRADNNTLLFARGTRWTPGLVGTNGSFEGWLIPDDLFNYNNFVIDAYGEGDLPIIDGSVPLSGWALVAGYSDVYRASMPGVTAYFNRFGNIVQGTNVPFFVRWAGSVSASLANSQGNALVQFYDYNTNTWYIKTPNNPSSNLVRAASWRLLASNTTSVKRYGFQLKNIRIELFASNPFIFAGLDGMLIQGCQGWSIGGIWRPEVGFYEGNWLDIRSGCDNAIIEDCVIEDVFDAGVSPQFASSWGYVWTSLSNVTIRNNTFRRCGLAGVEIVIQQPDTDLITGTLIEDNIFEDCGKGPFGWGSTKGGDGAAVNFGQNGSGSISALSTETTIRYNRIIDSQICNGDFKGPTKIYAYGNICTMSAGKIYPGDGGFTMIWTVSNTNPGNQQLYAYANVIDGYPAAFQMASWSANNFPVEIIARFNTILNCTSAFNGNSRANTTLRIANNTISNCTNGVTGWGSGTFQTLGGNRLSSVTTDGFTLAGTDTTGQPNPVFEANYIPPVDSGLYSDGVAGLGEYFDPAKRAIVAGSTTRNAYISYTTPPDGPDIDVPEPPPVSGRIVQSKHVQLASFASQVDATASASFDAPVSAGNTVVVCLSGWNFAETSTVFNISTDNQANSYTSAGQVESGASSHFFTALHYSNNVTSSGTFTVNINFTTANSANVATVVLMEIAASVPSFDKVATTAATVGTTGITVGPTAVLASQPQLLIMVAGVFSANAPVVSVPVDWEILHAQENDAAICVATKYVTATTAQSVAITHLAADNGSSAILSTFRVSEGNTNTSGIPPILRRKRK